MKRSVIIFLVFIASISSALAYPISPRPLRQLVMESKYIIVGYVVKTYTKDRTEDDWNTKVARIAVSERLQGNIKQDTIEIGFNPGMICPAPDRYYDSTWVISFIDEEKDGSYSTHALSYGVKTLSKEETEIYKLRIAEIRDIIQIRDKSRQQAATVEWLVKCAENPVTRWEGTYELSPESDFMSYYSRKSSFDFKSILNDDHKKRLYSALINTKELSYNDFALIDLIYKGNEEEIDKLMIKGLRALKEADYWRADDFMKRLQHRNDSAELQKILETFNKFQYDYEYSRREILKKSINDFLTLVDH